MVCSSIVRLAHMLIFYGISVFAQTGSATDFVLIDATITSNNAPPSLVRQRIQAIFDNKANRGKAFHFAPGNYKIDGTLTLPLNTILMGNSVWEQNPNENPTLIQNDVNSDPLLACTRSACRVEIHNLAFKATNILKLNCDTCTNSQSLIISECTFDHSEIKKNEGIGIEMSGHDYSTIHHCNFKNFSGDASIRILGGLKNTTQVTISDCGFLHDLIGISMELVDNVKIIGNDFGGANIAPIDLGGRLYRAKRGLAADSRTGKFTNVVIRDNHFECARPMIYADGLGSNGLPALTTGIRIESNGFLGNSSYQEDSAMLEIKNCNGVSTYNNSVLLNPGDTQVENFKFARTRNSVNSRFLLDNFSYSGAPPALIKESQIVVDAGGNSGTMYWIRHPENPALMNKLSGNLQQEHPNFGSGVWPGGMTLSGSIEFSASGWADSPGSPLDLGLSLSQSASGLITIMVLNGGGPRTSTWSVGSAGGTPVIELISREAYTAQSYGLSIEGGRLIYRRKYANGSGTTRVAGTFTGLR